MAQSKHEYHRRAITTPCLCDVRYPDYFIVFLFFVVCYLSWELSSIVSTYQQESDIAVAVANSFELV